MLPVRNISYSLPMCCSFWENCINSHKTGQGCSTPSIKVLNKANVWNGEVLQSVQPELKKGWVWKDLKWVGGMGFTVKKGVCV